MTRSIRTLLCFSLTVVLAACAVRLGGPSPVEYDVTALFEPRDADANAVAARIMAAESDIVLLAAEREDSAWFNAVGAAAKLAVSGPGTTTGRGYAFLTNLEILGDTTMVLNVPGGGAVHMHDALFKVDENRFIDLMLVRLDGPDLRATVRTLLDYIATDVPADAPLILAFDGPSRERADSAAVMIRATSARAIDCREDGDSADAPVIELMYGPSARIRCVTARNVPGMLPGIVARLEVGRW